MTRTRVSAFRWVPPFAQQPVLDAYRLRCEARPAFQKAMADHMAPFAKNAPPGK